MPRFFLRSCDRSGKVLLDQPIHATDVYAALAKANRALVRMRARVGGAMPKSVRSIQVASSGGAVVAQLLCSEERAATG